MKRREFIAGIGGAVTATALGPCAVRAQQRERMRRIGVLMGWSEKSAEFRSLLDAFKQEMARLGWADGRNVRMDVRWTDYNIDRARILAKELVASRPDAILCSTTLATAALQRETWTIPIVFAAVADPVGQRLVASIPRPGGNITGFSNYDGAIAGYWLQMIKEFAPDITRAAAMYNPDTAPYATALLDHFNMAAKALGIEPMIAEVRSDPDIEAAIDGLGGHQGGLVLMPDGFIGGHVATIIAAANRNGVPTIFETDNLPRQGGLLSYGASFAALFRGAAGYIDRVLRGEKPSDLPVQLPIRYRLVINRKTAKALGLSVPNTLLVSADEVID